MDNRGKHRRKELYMCTRRHQRRIIQAETEREAHQREENFSDTANNDFDDEIFDMSSEPLNNSLDNNNAEQFDNNNAEQFDNNNAEQLDNNNAEQFDNNNAEQFDNNNAEQFDNNNAEQLELPSNVLDHDVYELPRNFSDESDESIDDDVGDTTSSFDTLKADLAQWALKYAIHHNAINELLHIILKYIPNCFLPRDARTLLCTPRKTNVVDLAGGEYLHFGLETVLNSLMREYKSTGLTVNNIKLSLNIDGLPISRSSTNSFWPILISDHILRTVQIIGVYYGTKKPTSANDYLRRVVDEFKAITNDGFIYENKLINTYQVELERMKTLSDNLMRIIIEARPFWQKYPISNW
ncbi:uncharacterized protein [Temnothorax nylanderi]|uniref:uncharacterized protein isoform X2 n=1 Tax=Temnothorax nylanderi TaxID=102681 RepID=UPI003A857E06